METTVMLKNEKNYATFIHLSALTKYIFPFGNYLFPILLWGSKKDSSEFINHHGKQVLNFQLSVFLYSLLLLLISVPTLLFTLFANISFHDIENGNFIFDKLSIENSVGIISIAIIAIVLFCFLKIAEFFLIIYGSIKTNEGEYFKYPFTIQFLK